MQLSDRQMFTREMPMKRLILIDSVARNGTGDRKRDDRSSGKKYLFVI